MQPEKAKYDELEEIISGKNEKDEPWNWEAPFDEDSLAGIFETGLGHVEGTSTGSGVPSIPIPDTDIGSDLGFEPDTGSDTDTDTDTDDDDDDDDDPEPEPEPA